MSTIQLERFSYIEPGTIQEASKALKQQNAQGNCACILAGGIDLIPRIRSGSIKTKFIVNIASISGLSDITYCEGKGFTFGAMAKLHELDTNKDLLKHYPAVQKAIHQITSVQSKYMGTAVGNLCLATPASDVAPALMAYDAELTISGDGTERKVMLCDFYLDYRKVDLAPDEFVTKVFIPDPKSNSGDAFLNRVRTHADIAKITVAVVVQNDNGICTHARIAIGAAAPIVLRAISAEKILVGQIITSELQEKAAEAVLCDISPITDFRSTKEYRLEMAQVLTSRALHKAFETKGGNE